MKLDISHNHVSDDGAVAISKWLKTNNTLTKLDISWNKITDNGAVSIAKAIQTNRTLQKLDVSHNKISKNIVTVLGICLKYNNTLDELIISWNDIDTTFVYISTTKCYVKAMWPLCISHNHTQHLVRTYNLASDKYLINTNNIYSLTDIEFDKSQFDDVEAILLTSLADGNVKKLEITNNEISDKAVIVISDFLRTNKTLRQLEFTQNTISDENIEQIIKAIQSNTTLQTLDISSNNISNEGIVAISECFTINNALQELSLSWNSNTTEGITKIAEAIAVNTGLHTLDVSSQHVNDPVHFTMTLLTAMEHNHTMMRIVLPASVNKIEAGIKNKLVKINEGRIKKDTKRLVLDSIAT